MKWHSLLTKVTVFFLFFCNAFAITDTQTPVRIKDLVDIRGVRANPLFGFGLVVGLAGTGDSKGNLATNKAVANLLSRLGSLVNPNEVTTKNTAAVVVNAELPAFARIGDKIDIRLSSIGDASSLEGGTLLLTPLTAADGVIYSVAQGTISMGTSMGGAQGGGGNTKDTAPKTIALAHAASVEKEFEQTFIRDGSIELSLKNADFTTASRVTFAVNQHFHEMIAEPVNAALIRVRLPSVFQRQTAYSPVHFMSELEQISVQPDSKAIVIIAERTGTIISGGNVVIEPVAISHGNLQITVNKKNVRVSQLPATATVNELASSLNALGAGPKDLVAILQALQAAKALKAELRLM